MSLHDLFIEFMEMGEFLWNSESFAAFLLIALTIPVIITIADVIKRDRR